MYQHAMNGGVLVARLQFPHPGILDPAANPAARAMHETALKAHADHSTALAEIKANREHTRGPVLAWSSQPHATDRHRGHGSPSRAAH
jgi:hypothetical protein